MTVGMKQHKIVYVGTTAVAAPEQVVHVPSCFQRQRLTADPTLAVLLPPEVTRCPATDQGAGHLRRQTLLEVPLPGRVVRIGLPSDFHVSPDGGGPCLDQPDRLLATCLVRDRAAKALAAASGMCEVFRLYPSCGFVSVSPSRPTP